jgi:benzylsuccinate CoA-transferase BbsF subunit
MSARITDNPKKPGPLAGLRVADFTWIGAGAYTTKILADFGAEVIKVESSTRMDPLRATAPFKDGQQGVNRSGYFADRNSSKRAMQLNLKHPDGQMIARQLIAKSDIVANNFTPGIMDKLGLGYDVIAADQPNIIYLSMSMQGAHGPESGYVGFGLTIAALTGMQYLSGQPDRTPMGTGTNYPDHLPNPCHAAFAVLAALHHRRKTGQGQFIDFAQTEPTIALLGTAMVDYAVNGHDAGRCGNDHPLHAPHGAYPCRDQRWISIAIETDMQWRALVAQLDLGHVLPDGNWSEAAQRHNGRKVLDACIAQRTLKWEVHALMHALQATQVPAGVAQNIAELVDQDPQLAHRQHWVWLDHAEMGKTLYNAPPFRLSRTGFAMEVAAPLLGEHTDEVCRDLLGISQADVVRFRADGVFE